MHVQNREQIWYRKDEASNDIMKAMIEKEKMKEANQRMLDILAERDNDTDDTKEKSKSKDQTGILSTPKKPKRAGLSTPAPVRNGMGLKSSTTTPAPTTQVQSKTGRHVRYLEQKQPKKTYRSLAPKRKRYMLSDDELDLPFQKRKQILQENQYEMERINRILKSHKVP